MVNSQGQPLSDEITVQTRNDNDFVGFVLGYNEGDVINASADYILIDWKQSDQTDSGGFGPASLAISCVTRPLKPNVSNHGANDAFTHTGVVEELARATTLGSTRWDTITT